MKLKRIMAMIALLAVISWLAIPALQIWRNPALLVHHHVFSSQDRETRQTAEVEFPGDSLEVHNGGEELSIRHELTYRELYRATLFGEPIGYGRGMLNLN